MFRLFVLIDGPNFDPDHFQNAIGGSLGGVVRSRKRMRNGVVELADKYWRSGAVEGTSGHPEEQLQKLLERLKPGLMKIGNVPGIRILAELVVQFDDLDSVHGFFFSPETIELLAEVGAGLDVDFVQRLSAGKGTTGDVAS